MTGESHYAGAFWTGTEFCSSSGFDTLVKHMHDGRTSCKCLANFIRQRSKVDEEYARSIEKLNKTTDFGLEIGTLRQSAEQLKTSTDKIVQDRLAACKEFTDRAQFLIDFTNEQKRTRLKEEAVLKRANDSKCQAYSRMLDAKKKYMQKSQDYENAETAHQQAQSMPMPASKWEKIVKDVTKCKSAAEQADGQYRTAIRNLDDERDKWERQMVQFSEFCEQQDIDRAVTLHDEMWKYSNVVSETCVKEDQHCEDVRKSLESVNVAADLLEFIDKASTGTERPAQIMFEPYQGQRGDNGLPQPTNPASPPRSSSFTSSNVSSTGMPTSRQPPSLLSVNGTLPRPFNKR